MKKGNCPVCRVVRTVVLSLVLGGVAGFAADAWGAGPEGSMLATFGGAITPWLWWSRRNRLAVRKRN